MQTRKKSPVRHLTAVILCLVLTLTTLQMTVWAVELNMPSSLTITAGTTLTEQYGDDVKEANIVVDLYKVADAVPVPGVDTYAYDFAPYSFNKLEIDNLDMASLKSGSVSLSSEQWEELALLAAGQVHEEGGMKVEGGNGTPIGNQISNLSSGLYLIIARGADIEDYWDTETENLATVAQSSRYRFSFTPALISLPTKGDGNEVVTTAASYGEWNYNPTPELKASVEPRYGGITIEKYIDEFKGNEEVTFVFQIDAEGSFPDEPIYDESIIRAVAFDASTGLSTTVVVDGIRAGAEVTVTERDSGPKYQIDHIEAPENNIIIADTTDQVVFKAYNTFLDRVTGGHGIQNHFTYTESSWIVEQQDAGNGLNR